MPSATRRGPRSYAFETSDEESGCWTEEPRPARRRQPRSPTKPPAKPAATNPRALIAVPATSSRASPQRSASKLDGIWNPAIPPLYAVFSSPT